MRPPGSEAGVKLTTYSSNVVRRKTPALHYFCFPYGNLDWFLLWKTQGKEKHEFHDGLLFWSSKTWQGNFKTCMHICGWRLRLMNNEYDCILKKNWNLAGKYIHLSWCITLLTLAGDLFFQDNIVYLVHVNYIPFDEMRFSFVWYKANGIIHYKECGIVWNIPPPKKPQDSLFRMRLYRVLDYGSLGGISLTHRSL